MDPLAHLQTALSTRYRVERLIGVGGMATVYLARDLRHDRNVALKLLKPELGAVLGVERFLSEIRVTANLQHPHLLPLFDSGEADGMLYYVMPFVEGESLRNRLDREKQLPVPEAIRITIAAAGALDYAHRHNVVHRDLKPENILLQDGQPVVSDFGIALAVTNAGGTRVTQTGLSLGTPQYMSPEQATGDRVIDARSDIYSLGAVLYEMLTGEPPHTGATVQAIIARVLTDKARSVRATRDMVPENVDAAIQRALAKLPADRFATAKEFADALQDARYTLPVTATSHPEVARASGRANRIRTYAPWAVAAAATIVALVSLASKSQSSNDAPAPARFDIALPDSVVYSAGAGGLAISRDGTQIAFVVRHAGTQKIAVRELRETEARVVTGTENATRPFFSPDGATLGFVGVDRISTVPITGGVATTMASFAGAMGTITWSDAGIVFTSDGVAYRVPPSGGKPVVFVSDSGSRYLTPSAGPGGRVLFSRVTGDALAEIVIAEPDGRVRAIAQTGNKPQWVGDDFVLYNASEGTLMAVRVDPKRMTRIGAPILVQDGVRVGPNGVGFWVAAFSGTLVVERGRDLGGTLGIVDRNGRFTALYAEPRKFRLPRVSPDGHRIAVQVGTSGTNIDSDLWVLDRGTGALSRFTSSVGNSDPIWAPDGRHIIYAGRERVDSSGSRSETSDIFRQDIDQTSPPELLLSEPGNQYPWGVTPDGKTLIFDALRGSMRIRAMTIGDPKSVRDIVANNFTNRLGKLSNDGKWLAYVSNETGRTEVYVRPFPGPGGAKQVSVDGGDQPLWSRDDRELYFRDGNTFMVATIVSGTAKSRNALFADTYQMNNATNYDVLPDGRFVMLRGPGDTRLLTVMVNWATELKQRSKTASP